MLLWMDGPDHYGTNINEMLDGAYASIPGYASLYANSGPGGVGTVIQFANNLVGLANALRKVLPGSRVTVGIGTRIFLDSLPGGNNDCAIMDWRDGANNIIASLFVQSTGALALFTGNAGTLVYQTAPIIVSQSWQHIEVKLKANAAGAGAYQINVNGLPVAQSDGITTATSADVSQIAWRGAQGRTSLVSQRDLFIWDDQGTENNGMLGDRQVLTSYPNNDGTEQAWLKSAGQSGWPLISNVPADDKQYVYSDNAGDLSDFGIDPIDTTITSIAGIRIAARAFKSDAGIGTLSLNMVSGGAKTTVVEQAISTEPIYYSQIVEHDPNTNAKWTPANLNAAQVELDRVQ